MERMQAKEVASILGFTTVNLKIYANLLEQNGLKIHRNAKNHREYTQEDLKLLQAMIFLNKEKSMLLDEAASFVTSSDTDINEILSQQKFDNIPVLTKEIDSNVSVLSVLSSMLQEQKQLRIDIEKRDEQHFQAMKEASEQIVEQNKALMTLKNELAELKKAQEEQKPQGFWAKLFG